MTRYYVIVMFLCVVELSTVHVYVCCRVIDCARFNDFQFGFWNFCYGVLFLFLNFIPGYNRKNLLIWSYSYFVLNSNYIFKY